MTLSFRALAAAAAIALAAPAAVDAGAATVEGAREALWRIGGAGLVRELGGSENDAMHRFPDERDSAAGPGGGAAVMALVCDDGAGRGVRTEAQAKVSNIGASAFSPPVISKAIGWPSKSVFI